MHLHGMWELSNYQVASICRRAGVPYVYSPHGMLDDWAMGLGGGKKRLVLALAGRRALAGARRVHFAARGEMEQSSARLPRANGAVVPLVFDLAPYRSLPEPGAARGRFAATPRFPERA